MPNIASIFKQEITRLARREIRSQTAVVRKATAQFRRDIAELKRQAAKLKAEVVSLQRQAARNVAPVVAQAEPQNGRYSVKSVIAQRKRLGLSAADFGKLIGVTAQSIFNWEHSGSRPRQAQINALASLRSLGKTEALARLEQLRDKAPKKRAAKR